MTIPKREGYTNIELDIDDAQELVANMFIHEGELREQDAIWELLVKKTPPLLSNDEYDRGFEAGYDHAMSVINERILGPAETVTELVEQVEEQFDVTDVDDPE